MRASTTSPFSSSRTNEGSWILWEKRNDINSLPEEKQTDCLFEKCKTDLHCGTQDTPASPPVTPHIQRQKYIAVLDRMNQALGNSGSFSAWKI